MKKKDKLERKAQSVILTFNDGTSATFTGRAVCFPGETRRIRNICFTEPRDLPKDCHFETLGSLKGE